MTILRPARFISNRSGMTIGRRPAGTAGRVDIGSSFAPAGARPRRTTTCVPSIATTSARAAPPVVTYCTGARRRPQLGRSRVGTRLMSVVVEADLRQRGQRWLVGGLALGRGHRDDLHPSLPRGAARHPELLVTGSLGEGQPLAVAIGEVDVDDYRNRLLRPRGVGRIEPGVEDHPADVGGTGEPEHQGGRGRRTAVLGPRRVRPGDRPSTVARLVD